MTLLTVSVLYIFFNILKIFASFYNVLCVWIVDMLKRLTALIIKNLHIRKPHTQTRCIKTEKSAHFIHF